jgi:hypothetical protein
MRSHGVSAPCTPDLAARTWQQELGSKNLAARIWQQGLGSKDLAARLVPLQAAGVD